MWTCPAIFTLGKFELSFSPISHLNVYIIFQGIKIELEDTIVFPVFFFFFNGQIILFKSIIIQVFHPFKNMFENLNRQRVIILNIKVIFVLDKILMKYSCHFELQK